MWYQVELREFSLYTRHHFYDPTHNVIDSVYFEFLKSESAGTLRFLVLACFMAYAIKQGQLILIDEIDSKFHSDLLQLLIQFYNDPNVNVLGSQMIFTTHNTILLNNVLRRDQIILVEKNEFGESTIRRAHSADNPIRLDTSIEKEYRKGKLGGVSKKLKDDRNQGSFEF
jgi:AAA15 family ATPase/GTPase